MSGLLFKNKYRIASARLSDYDYSENGWYFVTICTYERKHYFGEIVDGKMFMNAVGKLADKYWRGISMQFPFVVPDTYVVMPNHVHGIIHIDHNDRKDDGGDTITNVNDNFPRLGRDEACLVSTNGTIAPKLGISPKPGSLSTIVGSYKSSVTRESKPIDADFRWQTRFYDKIIRNDNALNKIREYIINNPVRWGMDRNNVGIWM